MAPRNSRRKSIRIEDFIDQDPPNSFVVKKVSDEVGKGVFADRDFSIGDFLLIYRGKRLKAPVDVDNDYIFSLPSKGEFFDVSDELSSGIAR